MRHVSGNDIRMTEAPTNESVAKKIVMEHVILLAIVVHADVSIALKIKGIVMPTFKGEWSWQCTSWQHLPL